MPSQAQGPTNRPTSAVRFYLAIIRRRRVPIVICVLLPLALAAVMTSLQKPQYQATAQVQLSRQNLANALTNTPDPTGQANDFIRIVQTQADVARSPEVAARAIRQTGARLTPAGFLASSSVTPERDADLLTFHVVQGDKASAVRLTNAYARQFTEYRLALDTMALRKAQADVSKRLKQLNADPNTNGRLTGSLITKQQELGTLEALQTSNATLVRGADRAKQVAPRKKRNIILGLLVGLVLAGTLAAALESLDTRVRSEREIEERLGGVMLARVGPPDPALGGSLLMLEKPHSQEAEAFRFFRTNLQFATFDRTVRSILVTSSIQGEGKSTTIANLAVVLARAGERVVLVDLDLRRPSIRTLFGLPPGMGLTDVVLGRVSLDQAKCAVSVTPSGGSEEVSSNGHHGSLTILPAGTQPPNPGEIIASEAIAEIIRTLESEADIVLVDAPPALALGDALTLSALVDALFVCARLPAVTRSMLDELKRALGTVRAQTLGFVMTGDLRSGDGYGYGYGYASDPVEDLSNATAASELQATQR